MSPKKTPTSDNIVGSFLKLDFIAEGGFGTTYKGEHILTGAPVCIKHCDNVDPEYHQVLIDETLAIWGNKVRHFGIPGVKDLVKLEDGTMALVMDFIEGPTLEEIVDQVAESQHKRLNAEEVCWITERILNILMCLHHNGIVHGDIKPQNIIIQDTDHTLVLVDYGLSAVKPTEKTNARGYTPHFSPPEQESGDVLIPESDYYALGMTMIYALGGDVEKLRIPSDAPAELVKFIKSLIRRDPLSRPNPEEVNLFEKFKKLRIKIFGQEHTGMKPIRGLK